MVAVGVENEGVDCHRPAEDWVLTCASAACLAHPRSGEEEHWNV